MRFRSAAALGLVLAFLASPIAAVACVSECTPPLVAPQAFSAPRTGDCHGIVSEGDAAVSALTKGSHDCASHGESELLASLKTDAVRALPDGAAAGLAAIHLSPAAASAVSRTAALLHDLAPPGSTRPLIAPLRI